MACTDCEEVLNMEEETKNKVALLQQQDLFINLVDECQSIVLEIKQHGWAMIVAYHKLGKRLSRDKEQLLVQGYTMTELLETVSNEVHRSRRTLYYAIKFYETYKDIELTPYSEDTPWFQIVKSLTKAEKKQLPKITSKDNDLKAIEETIAKNTNSKNLDKQGDLNALRANPPVSNWVWDKELELWRFDISHEELYKVDIASLRTRIDEFINSA